MTEATALFRLRATLCTLLVGFAGGALFYWAQFPAAWLSGGMAAVALMGVLRFKAYMPDFLRDLCMLFAGVAIGSGITPEMLTALTRYPVSLALLMLTTFGIAVAGRWVLMRGFAWKSDEAIFAALPGALSAVLASVASTNIDMARVASVQAFRVFILIALLPSVVSMASELAVPFVPAVIAPLGFGLEVAGGLLLGLWFERRQILAPYLLGGMAASGLLHATHTIVGSPPDLVVNGSFLLVGIVAGARMAATDIRVLAGLLVPAAILFVVTLAVAAMGAGLTTLATGTSFPEALVAFAPGGLEAMVTLGLALGLDPLYVSSHHILRFVFIAAACPFIVRWLHENDPP